MKRQNLTILAIAAAVMLIGLSGCPQPNSGTKPVYGIGLDQTESYTFTAATEGYTAQPEKTVTITNTGNQPTGVLTVALSGTNSDSFTLSKTSIERIPVGGNDRFTVVPNDGLAVETYRATVTVSGGNGITANFELSFMVNNAAAYGISLDQTEPYTFPAVIEGYGALTAKTVTITNTGNQPTGALTVALSGDDRGSFTLSAATVSDIAVGGADSFTVVPNTGLLAGTYTATVTVSGGNGITANFDVSFTVNAAVYGISLDQTGPYTFPAADLGYLAPTVKTVTITNTGNQPTGILDVALSGTDSGSFTLSATSVSDIAVGSSDTFTVVPNTGLAIGTYTATVTVSGGNGITAGFDVSFTVNLPSDTALWARSVRAGTNGSQFKSVAKDSAGNVYAAGYQQGDGIYTYGTGVSAAGSGSGTNTNAVLVKYDSTGTALWAKSASVSVNVGSGMSQFSSVAVDGSGNVYAAGYQYGTGDYHYGSVSVAGTHSTLNVVLVKYDSAGTALWAKSVSAGSSSSSFNSVAVDSAGNVYAAGYQVGTNSFRYGSVAVTGTSTSDNVVLVKYDSAGTALWAKTVSAGSSTSQFNSVAVDSAGNVYATGYQSGSGSYTYGPGVSVAGSASGTNVVLVKYDSAGTAQWAKSGSDGSSSPSFNSVAVDSFGNVYAAGSQSGTGSYTYGPGVSVAGTGTGNVVLVKYDSTGTAQWAKSGSAAGSSSPSFNSVAVDSAGNVYAAGSQYGSGSYTYGPGVSAAGTYTGGNVVLVKYDSTGTALWAKSVSGGSSTSYFYSVAADSAGNVYAAGYQYGTSSYTYGPGVSVAGTNSDSSNPSNVILVKYRQ